jgi:hypothetical protein
MQLGDRGSIPNRFSRSHARRGGEVGVTLFGGGRTGTNDDTAKEKLMAKFDADTLRELRDLREIAIRTEKHPKGAVVIWIVVADDEVFVRSVRGDKGRWYRDLAPGGPATLEFAGRKLMVQAIPATDPGAIIRASDEYLRKYRTSPYAQSMVRAEVLPTTLRLEPR